MAYLEQALPPYSATPAGCSLRQRYPYNPIVIIIIFVIMFQCGNSNKLALQQANVVPCDRLLQEAY